MSRGRYFSKWTDLWELCQDPVFHRDPSPLMLLATIVVSTERKKYDRDGYGLPLVSSLHSSMLMHLNKFGRTGAGAWSDGKTPCKRLLGRTGCKVSVRPYFPPLHQKFFNKDPWTPCDGAGRAEAGTTRSSNQWAVLKITRQYY